MGKGYRGRGAAPAALKSAVEQIAQAGGGRIEGYSEDTACRKASPDFLFNGVLSTIELLGFERSRKIGKNKKFVALEVT